MALIYGQVISNSLGSTPPSSVASHLHGDRYISQHVQVGVFSEVSRQVQALADMSGMLGCW